MSRVNNPEDQLSLPAAFPASTHRSSRLAFRSFTLNPNSLPHSLSPSPYHVLHSSVESDAEQARAGEGGRAPRGKVHMGVELVAQPQADGAPALLLSVMAFAFACEAFRDEEFLLVAGSRTQVDKVVRECERTNAPLTALMGSRAYTDVHAVASVLRRWLVELPSPLVPLDTFTALQAAPNDLAFSSVLTARLALLPTPNVTTLKHLVFLLHFVCTFHTAPAANPDTRQHHRHFKLHHTAHLSSHPLLGPAQRVAMRWGPSLTHPTVGRDYTHLYKHTARCLEVLMADFGRFFGAYTVPPFLRDSMRRRDVEAVSARMGCDLVWG